MRWKWGLERQHNIGGNGNYGIVLRESVQSEKRGRNMVELRITFTLKDRKGDQEAGEKLAPKE